MAEAVVDVFEVVDVQEERRKAVLRSDRLVDEFVQGDSVRQSC